MPKRARSSSVGASKGMRNNLNRSFNRAGVVTNKRRTRLDPSTATVSNSPLKRFAGLAAEALAWGATLAYQYPPLLAAKFAYQAYKAKSLSDALTPFDKTAISAYGTAVTTIFGGSATGIRQLGDKVNSTLKNYVVNKIYTPVMRGKNLGNTLPEYYYRNQQQEIERHQSLWGYDVMLDPSTVFNNVASPSSQPATVSNKPLTKTQKALRSRLFSKKNLEI